MLFSSGKKASLVAGLFISAIGLSYANSSFAQSTTASPTNVSDTDYLAALNTMASTMDLNGLAGQTFEPVTVVAPQLPTMNASADVVSCDVLQAQADETGRPFEIFGADTILSDSELAAFSKCLEPETGVTVSYLMPSS